jgi:hypothetical protein
MQRRILVLTSSSDVTSDYLCDRLRASDLEIARYNTDVDLPLSRFLYTDRNPVIEWREVSMDPSSISSVVIRRPKPLITDVADDPFHNEHIAREWTETWEGFLAHIPDFFWINHPALNFRASHKIEQLTRAANFNLQVPVTLVTNRPEEARTFVEQLPNGTIVKPLASGYC